MTIRISFIFLCYILPSICWGEIISTEIGHHEGYSRLVLTLPQNDTEWDVTASGETLIIEIENASGFDLSSIESQPEGGVVQDTKVITSSNRLAVTLSCECEVNSFVINNRYLAIDIMASKPQFEIDKTADDDSGFNLLTLTRPWHQQIGRQNSETLNAPSISRPFDTLQNISSVVSTSLATATYQGLLSWPLENSNMVASTVQNQFDHSSLESTGVGIETHSSIVKDPPDKNDMAPTCEAIAASLASGIRTDVSFGLAIGDARQTLAKEENDFGHLDVIPLAMLYIANGMGTEANALLSLQPSTPHSEALAFIAKTLDDANAEPPFDLSICSSDVALWQFLDIDTPIEGNFSPNELLLTFKTLPVMVQKKMRPQFEVALALHGNAELPLELRSFSQVQSATLRLNNDIPEPKEPKEQNLLRTDLAGHDFYTDLTRELDSNILKNDTLSSIRIEYRETPAERPLLKREIESHINMGNVLDAIKLLSDSRERIGDELYFNLINTEIQTAILALTDAEVTALVYRDDIPELTPSVIDHLSTRIQKLELRPPLWLPPTSNQENIKNPNLSIAQQDIELSPSPLVQVSSSDPLTFDISETMLNQSRNLRSNISESLGIGN